MVGGAQEGCQGYLNLRVLLNLSALKGCPDPWFLGLLRLLHVCLRRRHRSPLSDGARFLIAGRAVRD